MANDNQFQEIEVATALKSDVSHDPNCLLGRRFLCRGSAGMIIGEAGTGKSSFALQFACCLAVGQPFFGIKHPGSKPQQVLLVQSENDELEVAEVLQSIVAAEKWDQKKQATLHNNLHIYSSWDAGGEKFAQWLGELVKIHKIDIAFIDPLMSFCGCDVSSNREMSIFLRQYINTQLKARNQQNTKLMNFGLIVVHHTKKKQGKPNNDLSAYDMMGASELTNWARFVMHITGSNRSTTEQRVFDITITKRGNRSEVESEGHLGEYKFALQYSSHKVINPVKGNQSNPGSGTGLNWIHWEKCLASAQPKTTRAPRGKTKSLKPRGHQAGEASQGTAPVAPEAKSSAGASALPTATQP